MRLRLFAALTALSLSSGMAFASPGTVGASAASKVTGGVVAVGGGVGAAYGLSRIFQGKTQGAKYTAAASRAPEISTTGTTAGLILLVGAIFVLRGRKTALTVSE